MSKGLRHLNHSHGGYHHARANERFAVSAITAVGGCVCVTTLSLSDGGGGWDCMSHAAVYRSTWASQEGSPSVGTNVL